MGRLEIFKTAQVGEVFYWPVCDGQCSGTEFVWLPNAQRWIYYDGDSTRSGNSDMLTIIFSDVDGDESGLHRAPDLLAFEGAASFWVFGELPDDSEFPDDAEVYEVRDPADGVQAIELQKTTDSE